jgi:glycylpeptide N-tetradecanoyltransferase
MSPGWKKEWHVGVRATKSRKLVASICGVPTELRVRGERIKVTEINFLCIHKKLRSKRLTPVLIKEITRRCYVNGIYQAIYTGGVILPTPISSCRYYHRALDWLKLYEVGFSPLPHGSTKARMITKNHLPSATLTPGLRPMESKDIDAVYDLLERYMRRFDMNQAFTREEIDHWLVYKEQPGKEQVVWSYVVEDPETHKITDFVSFYNLESTVIDHAKHESVHAAYLYYYATETAFSDNKKAFKDRLQLLLNDALICAKKVCLRAFRWSIIVLILGFRPISTCSMPSLRMIIRCSLRSSSSAPAMVSCISTSTITVLHLLRVELMTRTFPMSLRWEALVSSCSKHGLWVKRRIARTRISFA